MGGDGGHLDGVIDIGLARAAALVLVRLTGEIERFVDHLQVGGFLARLPCVDEALVSSLDFFFLFFGISVG